MKKVLFWLLGIGAFVVAVKLTLLSHVDVCNDLQTTVKAELLTMNTCESDADCTFVQFSCPFDCVTPLNRRQVDEAQQAVYRYNQQCLMVCPECPKENVTRLQCRAGRCEAV